MKILADEAYRNASLGVDRERNMLAAKEAYLKMANEYSTLLPTTLEPTARATLQKQINDAMNMANSI